MQIILRIALYNLLLAHAACAVAECPPAAVQPTAAMMQAALSKARDHGFLWRISKNGRNSYLYGTIHVAKFEWLFPGPRVMQALRESDTVALELDMTDMDIQRRISQGMVTEDGAALDEALVRRMRKQAEAMCVPYESIAGVSPEMQVITLTVMAGRQAGMNAEYAIDVMLAGIGHKSNKKVLSLETPEMQLQVLDMQNGQERAAFVADSLDELESGRSFTMLKRIAQVWEDADHDKMAKYDEWCECLKTVAEREMMKRALDDRNPALAESIDALHQSGKRVFAAVGSLHMFGSFALPGLLEKRGYRVERILFQ